MVVLLHNGSDEACGLNNKIMATSTNIKSIVFKKAWSIIKATKKTLSQALKMAWAMLKRHESKDSFIAECHFEEVVLPFKRECFSNGVEYIAVIYKNRNKYGIEGWCAEIGDPVDSLVGFGGYVISITSKWFELFNAEQFKKDIDSLCLRIAGKKVTCKHESDSRGNFYKWAINPTSLDELLGIASKYKLKISLS